MEKEKIVTFLVEHIERTEAKTGEISLFSWGHALRGLLYKDYGISGDKSRILGIEAYNRTHPRTPYKINPSTLDNPKLNYENI
jgi:hypothetical protein